MPRSRIRHKHPHHHGGHTQQQRPAKVIRRSAVTIMVVFIGLMGTGVAFISAGSDPIWLITGALSGAVVGYFIGHGIDRLAKKNQ